jgi:AGZA family xanthine/uracil permease-like MFS transporter
MSQTTGHHPDGTIMLAANVVAFFQRRSPHVTAPVQMRDEMVAGMTTFLAMAYISVVNPAILAQAGMDFGAVFVATCLAAAFGSILMGLIGHYPVALAPGMGQNAFFTFSVVLGSGHTWQAALGAVFVSGILFILLSVLPVREWLINSIPRNLKLGISAGVGLFLAFIAFQNTGIVVSDKATLVSLGDLTAMPVVLCLLGFVVILALSARGVMGAVIIGVLSVSVIGWITGIAEFKGVVSLPPPVAPVFMQLDILGALQLSMVPTILTLLLVDLFDTAGTLVGVGTRARMLDAQGRLPNLRGALLADSTATAAGALFGTSSTTSYIESAAGVEAGGRTGLTAIFVGFLFLLCLFFSPLAQSVPAYATASALLFVACLMARGLETLDWDDYSEAAPAVLTALTMPLAFSIADGIGVGFILYALLKLASGKPRSCSSAVYAVAATFAIKFAFLD